MAGSHESSRTLSEPPHTNGDVQMWFANFRAPTKHVSDWIVGGGTEN